MLFLPGPRWVEIVFRSPSRSTILDWGPTSHLCTLAYTTRLLRFLATYLRSFPQLAEHITRRREMLQLAMSLHRVVPETSWQHFCPRFLLVPLLARSTLSVPTMVQHLTRGSALPSSSTFRQRPARSLVRCPSLPTQRSSGGDALLQQAAS